MSLQFWLFTASLSTSQVCVWRRIWKLENTPIAAAPQRILTLEGKGNPAALETLKWTFAVSRVWDQPLPLQREQCHSSTLMWQRKGVCLGQASLPSGYRHGGSRLTVVLIASLQKAEIFSLDGAGVVEWLGGHLQPARVCTSLID